MQKNILNLRDLDVVILCGGMGKRLRTVTGESQKVLASVGGRPFLDILLEHLAGQGFSRVILCTGFHGEALEERYRKNTLGLDIRFSPEKEPMGTGGAIKNAQSLVKSSPFFALNGDCFCALDYHRLLAFHEERKACATLVVSQAKERKDFGSIVLGRDKKIINFEEKVEKPRSQEGKSYISNGIYCFNKEIFSLMPGEEKFSIETDFFPAMVGRAFFGYEGEAPFIDIGTPERYRQAQQILK